MPVFQAGPMFRQTYYMASDFGKCSIFGAVLLVVVSSYSAVVKNMRKRS